MTRFIPLASAAVLIFVLAGCGTEPAQQSDVAPEQSEVTAGESPAMVETMPIAEETATASAPAAHSASREIPPQARTCREGRCAAAGKGRAGSAETCRTRTRSSCRARYGQKIRACAGTACRPGDRGQAARSVRHRRARHAARSVLLDAAARDITIWNNHLVYSDEW